MKDILGMMKQAKDLQSKMQALQEEIAALRIAGAAGGGLVKITLSGKGELVAVAIDRSLLKPDEGEILEDLLVAAHGEARAKVEAATAEKMRGLTGGLSLPPGLKLPF